MFRTINSIFSSIRRAANTLDHSIGLAEDFVINQRGINRTKYQRALAELTELTDEEKAKAAKGAELVRNASDEFNALQVTFTNPNSK